MARARNIKPGFFTNEKLGELPPLARLLFAGLWTVADREGRLEDRPKRIKAQTLPYDEADVEVLLDLLEGDFIHRYEINGCKYIHVINWSKHQTPHHKEAPSELPPPISTNVNQSPEKASTGPEKVVQERPSMTTQVVMQSGSCPTDSLNLIPDSLNPLTEAKPECVQTDMTKSEKDEMWDNFRREAGSAGMAGSEVDWQEARSFEWDKLDFFQQFQAINDVKARKLQASDCYELKALPKNYLHKRMWERPIRSNSNRKPNLMEQV